MTLLKSRPRDDVSYLPPGFTAEEPGIQTGCELVQQSLGRWNTPLVMFGVESDGVRLRNRRPIVIHVRNEGSFTFAENESLCIHAHGKSLDEAVQQFQRHIVHFFRYYASLRDDQITGEAVRLKSLFAQIFVKA